MYEYEIYETLQEIDAELELEQEIERVIQGGGQTTPQRGQLKLVRPTGNPTREDRRRQLLDAANKAMAARSGIPVTRFCSFYNQFVPDYPELAVIPAIRIVHGAYCGKRPKKEPPPKSGVRRKRF